MKLTQAARDAGSVTSADRPRRTVCLRHVCPAHTVRRMTPHTSDVKTAIASTSAVALLVAGAAVGVLSGTAQAATPVQCQVTYAVSSDWGSGFGTNITV